MTVVPLKAPLVYFGGKGRVASLIWERFGDVPNLVDPFMGSMAVLLARPHEPKLETVNDLDGLLVNAYRGIQFDPAGVAKAASWPVSEACLHARHLHLVKSRETLTQRLMGDPRYFDAELAGWWLWGCSSWIGTGWCSGEGPWIEIDGEFVDSRQLPHLSGSQGVNRQLPHLSGSQGVNRKLPHLAGGKGGVNKLEALTEMMTELSNRLCDVRICCGDWARLTGPSVTFGNGLTAVLLDPPYASDEHSADYASSGSTNVSADVRSWAITQGDNPLMRIAYCSYGDTECPEGWERVNWKTAGGYGNQGSGRGRENAGRECIDFSPHCLKPVQSQTTIFDFMEENV